MDDTLPAALAADLDRAFPLLVAAHQDRLFSIALRLLGDRRDAEEVAQDAFVRAYRALAGYDADRVTRLRLRAWLATIVVNACRNRRRGRSPAAVRLDGDEGPSDRVTTDPADDPHAAAVRREATERWAGLLAELPDRHRVPVVLRHVDGLSYAEMAEVLGRPEGTLKAQVHRGLVELREAALRLGRAEREEMTA